MLLLQVPQQHLLIIVTFWFSLSRRDEASTQNMEERETGKLKVVTQLAQLLWSTELRVNYFILKFSQCTTFVTMPWNALLRMLYID